MAQECHPHPQGQGASFCIVIKLQSPQTSWLPGRGLTIANWTPNGQSYQLGARGQGVSPTPLEKLLASASLRWVPWFAQIILIFIFSAFVARYSWLGDFVFSSVSPTHFTAMEKGHISFSGDVFIKYPSKGEKTTTLLSSSVTIRQKREKSSTC